MAGIKKSSQNCWTVYSWMTSYVRGVCKWSNFENGQLYNFQKVKRVKIAECISTRLWIGYLFLWCVYVHTYVLVMSNFKGQLPYFCHFCFCALVWMHRESKNGGGLGARIAGGSSVCQWWNHTVLSGLQWKLTLTYKSSLLQTRVTQWIPQDVL